MHDDLGTLRITFGYYWHKDITNVERNVIQILENDAVKEGYYK